MKKLTESLLKAQKINHRFVVIFVDLDRFKLINDSLGHLIGDKLLIAVSKRLKKCLPPESTISRFGSDEFFILLEQEIEEEQLVLLLEEMQKQISLTYNIFGQDININSSFGVVYYDQEHQTAEDLLRDSGTALHIAKSQGRARFVIFNEDMRAKSLSQIQLEKDLQGAIERDELYLVYQPIVALENAKPVGFEALVRWQHPTLGLVSPTDFIPIAEENGMIVKIGKFVFGEACRQLQRWQSEFLTELPLTMSINLSAKQLLQQNLLTEVLETLETYGVSPNKIKLEITESVIVENTDVVISILKQFRAMGVKLSMDDFGTGYSSLSYLHRLPINTLKIDRSFVTQMSKKHESFEIIKTIIFLAQNLDLEVVAEGIETAEQHEVLTKLGCQLGQGYYFSKPLNVADADKFINDSFTDINRVIAQPIEYRLSSKFEN